MGAGGPITREAVLAELTGPGGPFEIVETEIGGVPQRIYANAPRNLREVYLGTRIFGPRDFLVYQDDRWTYDETFRRVSALAHLLADRSIRLGDRVAIGMRNYPEWVVSFWACQAIGAVAVTLNAWWTGEELEYALSDSGAKAAILDGERLERLDRYLDGLPLEVVLGVRDAAGSSRAELLDDVLAPYLNDAARIAELPAADIEPEAPSTIMYTSGTTGRPKGAVATQHNHVTNITNSLLSAVLGARLAAEAAGAPAQPADAEPPQPVSLQTFPFFHIGGLSGLYVTTAFGGRLVLMYRWDAGEALRLVEAEGVSSIAGVPTVVRQLLERAAGEGRALSTLGGIASGGAPVPPDLIDTIGSRFERRVAPGNGYGLTETTSAVITNGGMDYFEHPDSVGRPVPVADVRVVDDKGVDVPDGQIGEIWVRGPNVVQGYWNKPEATAEAFTDGWFHTGDVGYRSPEGFYYVVDRKKDVVIRGGENVYCAEVEAVLFEHPAVQDVAIIGLPHRELGEEVAAVVEPRPGHEIDVNDLQAFVASRLARFKVPTQVIVIEEPLPRTATGKVLKRQLKERYGAR
ncbi:MAG TPA: class I adenylate-forming enzyme family protein [Pseudomonadales bacterium]